MVRVAAHLACYLAIGSYLIVMFTLIRAGSWARYPFATLLFCAQALKWLSLFGARIYLFGSLTPALILVRPFGDAVHYTIEAILLSFATLATLEAFYCLTDHRLPPAEQKTLLILFSAAGFIAVAVSLGLHQGSSPSTWYRAIRQHWLTALAIGPIVAALYLYLYSVPFGWRDRRHGLFLLVYNALWSAAGFIMPSTLRDHLIAQAVFYASLSAILLCWRSTFEYRDSRYELHFPGTRVMH